MASAFPIPEPNPADALRSTKPKVTGSNPVGRVEESPHAGIPDVFKRWAETYHPSLNAPRAGIPVFPLHDVREDGTCSCKKMSCNAAGKHPRTRNGVSDATTDEKQIKRWWRDWPANIGGAGGRFVCLDVDARSGGFESLADLNSAAWRSQDGDREDGQRRLPPRPASSSSLCPCPVRRRRRRSRHRQAACPCLPARRACPCPGRP
jgi:Bifunctional DNA primase/polymerase, N-terminal